MTLQTVLRCSFSKAGLPVGDYNGTLIISSEGALNSVVNLSGGVKTQTSINEITLRKPGRFEEYYSITGRRIKNTAELNGFFIVESKCQMEQLRYQKFIERDS